MLRSIGSVTFLALFMVGCGGGGGDSSSPPPPPPPPAATTVGGTVSGLVGSGLALAICRFSGDPYGKSGHYSCASLQQVSANGAFTLLGGAFPPTSLVPDKVLLFQQPSSPMQRCVVGNATIDTQKASYTAVEVACAQFSYATSAADNTLSGYSIDAITGALTALPGFPIATGTSPYAIVGFQNPASNDKKYVLVGNEGSNDVSVFAVNNTTGALTAVPGSPFAAGTDPQAIAPYGSGLYVANAGSDNVFVYGIDGNTGALTAPSMGETGRTPTSIVIDNNYGYIYVANHGGSNDISALQPVYGSLVPVPGSPFPAGGNPLSLALGAGSKFLYSANPDATNPSISGFRIDPAGGPLTPLSGSPFPLSVSHYMATDQTGTYLYVTSGANVVGYSIDATTGALTPLQGFPVAVGANAYSITIDPTNQFLYVANDGAANITGFRLDASTGALAPMSGSPFPAGNRPDFLMTF